MNIQKITNTLKQIVELNNNNVNVEKSVADLLNYLDKKYKVLINEYQAYRYTEKDNFLV